jgi:hypothetical protein
MCEFLVYPASYKSNQCNPHFVTRTRHITAHTDGQMALIKMGDLYKPALTALLDPSDRCFHVRHNHAQCAWLCLTRLLLSNSCSTVYWAN